MFNRLLDASSVLMYRKIMKIFLFLSITVFTVFCCHVFSQNEAEKLLRFDMKIDSRRVSYSVCRTSKY